MFLNALNRFIFSGCRVINGLNDEYNKEGDENVIIGSIMKDMLLTKKL